MKINFESDIDDIVDVTMRSVSPSSEFYRDLLATVVGFGGICGLIAYLWFLTWVASVIGFVIGAVFVLIFNYNIRERRVRKFYEKHYSLKCPIKIEVEINEKGLSFTQLGTTTIRDWKSVKAIEETDDAIYFQLDNKLFSAVRKRAFTSEAEKDEFIALASRLIQEHTVLDGAVHKTEL